MKTVGRLAVVVLAAGLFAGCSGSESGAGGRDEGHDPKYPDLFVTIDSEDGHSGGNFWSKRDSGYRANSHPRGRSTSDGTRVVCKPVYTGTSEEGDAFVLEVTIGDEKQTKEVVYKGERLELELADGVKFILEPNPLR